MEENLFSISTGVRGLDRMLLGGLHLGAVYDFYGASGVGKTQLCLQVSTLASSPKVGGVVLYVDPTGSFRPERLKEIAEERSLDAGMILSQVYLYEPRAIEEQIAVVNQIKKMSRKPNVIIIDGVTDLFLSRDDISTRILLGKHLHSLCLTALKEKVVILLTNQVRERLGAKDSTTEAGGNVMAQGAHFRVKLFKNVSGLFSAQAIQPPLRPREVYYKITRAGLVDA